MDANCSIRMLGSGAGQGPGVGGNGAVVDDVNILQI